MVSKMPKSGHFFRQPNSLFTLSRAPSALFQNTVKRQKSVNEKESQAHQKLNMFQILLLSQRSIDDKLVSQSADSKPPGRLLKAVNFYGTDLTINVGCYKRSAIKRDGSLG